jgi:hypothetical protein
VLIRRYFSLVDTATVQEGHTGLTLDEFQDAWYAALGHRIRLLRNLWTLCAAQKGDEPSLY